MRTTTLLLSMICLSLGLRAGHPNQEPQNLDSKRWKNGFIVSLKGDTLHGKIKINDFMDGYYDYQHLVSFIDGKGTSQFTPNDLSSFSYIGSEGNVTMQSVSSPDGDGHVFLRLYYSGRCKVYGFTKSEIKGADDGHAGEGFIRSSLIPTEKKYIQVGGSQFYPLKRAGFKKCMEEVFASCPHILSRLDSREYTYDNLQAMVNDYNRSMGK